MIRCDRAVARAALKLTNRKLGTELYHSNETSEIHVVRDANELDRVVFLKYPPEDIRESIERLAEQGKLNIVSMNPYDSYFTITLELKHWFEVWLDAYTKKFWTGVLTGIASDIILSLCMGIKPALAAAVDTLLRFLAGILQ